MTKIRQRNEMVRFHDYDALDFIRGVQEKIEEIEAKGGEGITIQTEVERDYDCDYGVLEFSYCSPETEGERRQRVSAERARKNSNLNQLRKKAKELGYRLEKNR